MGEKKIGEIKLNDLLLVQICRKLNNHFVKEKNVYANRDMAIYVFSLKNWIMLS
jgi:hypothetical protein